MASPVCFDFRNHPFHSYIITLLLLNCIFLKPIVGRVSIRYCQHVEARWFHINVRMRFHNPAFEIYFGILLVG